MTPITSYNYGHGNTERVKETVRIFTGSPELIKTACRSLPLFMTGITIFGLQRAIQNTFVALGQARVSLFIALLRKVFLLIPLACILPHFLGYKGVFLAESIADAAAAILCTIIFSRKFPKILQKGPGEGEAKEP